MMRIATLFCRHGSTKYRLAIDQLDDFYVRRLPDVDRELVLIDNSLPETYREPLGERRTLIGGSNRAWEFSAWDSGLAFLGERLLGFDFVHLVTSAFGELYTRYIERFDISLLGGVRGRAAAVGHIDQYNEPVQLFGRISQSWIRSCFFFVPAVELRLLGSLVSITDGTAFFSGNPANPFRPDAPLCPIYRDYIIGWLTGAGTGQGVIWHSRFALDTETLPLFEAKVLTVLNEHALSLRLRAQGCAMVDATWLAAQLGSMVGVKKQPGEWPHWRDQLARRDVDAVR
jgi:hypothetical protein